MTYDWAKPGVKVVCINDGHEGGLVWDDGEAPVVNETYTIKRVVVDSFGEVVFHLFEIQRTQQAILAFNDHNLGYGAFRFRPLVTKQLPQSLTCLLKNPKSVILPNEGQRWDTKEKVQ